MTDRKLRTAIVMYANGDVTETEAAEIAGLSRAQFRRYARTSGVTPVTASDPDSGPESV